MEKIVLFHQEMPDLIISINLYFNEKGQLIFDGQDIGTYVEQSLGDSDYEYMYTIEPNEVLKLYKILGVSTGDRLALLQAIKARFSSMNAYSLFGDFMKEHDIAFQAFTWI